MRGPVVVALVIFITLTLATLAATPSRVTAQGVALGIHAAYDVEGAAGDGAPGAGARAALDLTGGAVGLQATFDWFFGDTADYWVLGANVLWQVSLLPAGLDPYLGAGVGHLSFDEEDVLAERGNDTHLQLLGGAHYGRAARLSPFVELRYQFRGGALDDALIAAVGFTF